MNSDYLQERYEYYQREISRIMFHTNLSPKDKNDLCKQIERKLEKLEERMT